jgi:zinc and cadmium transporter
MELQQLWMQGAAITAVSLAAGSLALIGAEAVTVPPGTAHQHTGPEIAQESAQAVASGRLGTLLAFAAGFMLGAAFLHLLPHAIEGIQGEAGLYALGGFLGIHLLERYVMVHPCGETGCDFHKIGWAALGGFMFCETADGFSLASSTGAPGGTLPVFLAVVVHRVPEAYLMTRLTLAGWRNRRLAAIALLCFSLVTPLTAFLSVQLLGGAVPSVRYASMAISAGLLLAISTGDLLPEVHRGGIRRLDHLLAILCGVGIMFLVEQLEHGH